jgi:hypothetical protein
VAVDSPCPGAGFLSLGFEYTPDGEALPCMEAITPDAVHAALTRLGAV